MDKLNIILITIYLVNIYQCTSNQTSNELNILTDSVETKKTSFQLPKIIRNTGFDTSETNENNISAGIIGDYEKRPVFIDKNDYLSKFSSDNDVNSNNLLQSRNSVVKHITSGMETYRKSKNTIIDNTNGNFNNITNSTRDDKDSQTEKPNIDESEENVTQIHIATEIENSEKIENDENVVSENAEEIQNNIAYNISEPSKIKILNITGNLEITLENNLHKILGSLKAEKGKYLLPHLMEKFESTVLRPIKDTLDTIHIELSPEYNNNYGSQIQPNTPLFLQKLQEKKQKILNHFGIRCCNYDYPYPY